MGTSYSIVREDIKESCEVGKWIEWHSELRKRLEPYKTGRVPLYGEFNDNPTQYADCYLVPSIEEFKLIFIHDVSDYEWEESFHKNWACDVMFAWLDGKPFWFLPEVSDFHYESNVPWEEFEGYSRKRNTKDEVRLKTASCYCGFQDDSKMEQLPYLSSRVTHLVNYKELEAQWEAQQK